MYLTMGEFFDGNCGSFFPYLPFFSQSILSPYKKDYWLLELIRCENEKHAGQPEGYENQNTEGVAESSTWQLLDVVFFHPFSLAPSRYTISTALLRIREELRVSSTYAIQYTQTMQDFMRDVIAYSGVIFPRKGRKLDFTFFSILLHISLQVSSSTTRRLQGSLSSTR